MPIARAPRPAVWARRVIAVIVGIADARPTGTPPRKACRRRRGRSACRRRSRAPCRARRPGRSLVADLESALADDPEADVLQDRHAPRQRHRAAEMVDLQRRLFGLLVGMPVIVDGDRIFRADGGDAAGVDQRLGRREASRDSFRGTARRCRQRSRRRPNFDAASRSASSQVRMMSRIAASIVA